VTGWFVLGLVLGAVLYWLAGGELFGRRGPLGRRRQAQQVGRLREDLDHFTIEEDGFND